MTKGNSISRGLVVNIAWNSNGWVGQSNVKEDWEQSNFSDVQGSHSAHEWWNFCVDHPANAGNYVYGSFYPAGGRQPQISAEERLAVFFASRCWRDGRIYVVGVYLGAEFSPEGWQGQGHKQEGGYESNENLRCPRDLVWIAQPKNVIELNPERHLKGKRIGMSNFTYIGGEQIRNLLRDMFVAKMDHMTRLIASVRLA